MNTMNESVWKDIKELSAVYVSELHSNLKAHFTAHLKLQWCKFYTFFLSISNMSLAICMQKRRQKKNCNLKIIFHTHNISWMHCIKSNNEYHLQYYLSVWKKKFNGREKKIVKCNWLPIHKATKAAGDI